MQTTDDEKTSLILVWYDKNINNNENTGYKTKLEKVFTVHTFTDCQTAVDFIRNAGNVLVMSSGSAGKEFTEKIELFYNVLGVIIFTMSVDTHKTWAIQRKNIIGMFGSFTPLSNALEIWAKDVVLFQNISEKEQTNKKVQFAEKVLSPENSSIRKIVWFDPKFNQNKNALIIKSLKKSLAFFDFTVKEDSVGFIQQCNSNVIVVATGDQSQSFIEAIKDSENVMGIIHQTDNPTQNFTWIQQIGKTVYLCSEFEKFVTTIEDIIVKWNQIAIIKNTPSLSQSLITIQNSTNTTHQNEPLKYYHCDSKRVLDFAFVQMISHSKGWNEQTLLYQMTGLNTIYKTQIQILFDEKKSDLLKAICYIYSTNYIYRQFNERSAHKGYSSVMIIINAALEDMKKRPELMTDPNNVLYRGVRKDFIIKNDFMVGKQFYWPGFSSTSVSENVAKGFAGAEGFVFVINLSKTNPHVNVTLASGWSAYPHEQEILLFPYFTFKVTKTEEKQGYIYVYISQNEEDTVFTLESDNAWAERVKKYLVDGVNASCEKILMKVKDFCDYSKTNIEDLKPRIRYYCTTYKDKKMLIKCFHLSFEHFYHMLTQLDDKSDIAYKVICYCKNWDNSFYKPNAKLEEKFSNFIDAFEFTNDCNADADKVINLWLAKIQAESVAVQQISDELFSYFKANIENMMKGMMNSINSIIKNK